jgi:hypothetical protein
VHGAGVPVLIARRVPYVTYMLLKTCGVIIHQTYNQMLPNFDAELAEQARRKDNLGYHDIRVGNLPDERLKKFIGTNMPAVAAQARERFDQYKDLLEAFGAKDMPYHEFAARVRRRSQGVDEDKDYEGDPADWWDRKPLPEGRGSWPTASGREAVGWCATWLDAARCVLALGRLGSGPREAHWKRASASSSLPWVEAADSELVLADPIPDDRFGLRRGSGKDGVVRDLDPLVSYGDEVLAAANLVRGASPVVPVAA